MRKNDPPSIAPIVGHKCAFERLMRAGPSRTGSTALMTIVVLLAIGFLVGGCDATSGDPCRTYHSELEYFKAVIEDGPVGDHQIIAFADQVFLLRRSGWVKQTIDLLEDTKQMSNNQNFLVRWLAGTVYAQLPQRFGKANAARDDLLWCVDKGDVAHQAPSRSGLRAQG